MREPDETHNALSFQKRPGIYRWRRGSESLYVGMSRSLFKRIMTHDIIGVVEPLQEGDVIDLWFYDTDTSMATLERAEATLIGHDQPRYNIEHTGWQKAREE